MNIENEATRAWLYRIGLVAFALMVLFDLAARTNLLEAEPFGVVEYIPVLIGLGSTTLATRNTSRK